MLYNQMTSKLAPSKLMGIAVLALVIPASAQAQTIAYGDAVGVDSVSTDAPEASDTASGDARVSDRVIDDGRNAGYVGAGGAVGINHYGADNNTVSDSGTGDEPAVINQGHSSSGGRANRPITISPYIEAAQVFSSTRSPIHDSLTYTRVAVGVDTAIRGRNNEASVSLRYERRIGYGKSKSVNGDDISGLGRASVTLIPQTLKLEAGLLATRTRVEGSGASVVSPIDIGDSVTQVYSGYVGPSLSTHAGNVAINGHYHFGYTKLTAPRSVTPVPGQTPVDFFDHSTSHNAEIHAGTKAGEGLPVGVGLGAGYNQENVSNLDQRVRDFHARADLSLPVGHDLALVGGVGYEKVTISGRDALRDSSGNPVIGAGAHFVADRSSPRQIAFNTSGLIWDVGVMWRPSRRTSLEAYVGRRYGSRSVWGTFAYAPNDRSSLNVAVYDRISGFGSQVNDALSNLPTQFDVLRNPLNGGLTGCVSSQVNGGCISGALGSVRSAVFRSRGVAASYGVNLGRFAAGIGGGLDRRKFIAAPGTVLAVANGTTDQNIWMNAYLNANLGEHSSVSSNVHANWFQSGTGVVGDGSAIGATVAYNRTINRHLSANAAVGVDEISHNAVPNITTASALVGVRYGF